LSEIRSCFNKQQIKINKTNGGVMSKHKSKTNLSIAVLLIGYTASISANVYYVKQGSVNGNGSSWANAFNNLDSALAAVKSDGHVDQIWVAKGTYKPSKVYAPNGIVGGAYGVNTPNLKTFDLPSNVSIYGGFVGNETNINARNRDANPTILSGDLAGNDINDPNHTQTNKSDNVWHILNAGNDISQTGVTGVVLDSIIVTDGYAGGPDQGTLGPNNVLLSIDYAHAAGGGLLARFGSKVTLNNVRMEYNASDGSSATIIVPGLGATKASGGGSIASIDEGTFVTVNSADLNHNTSFFTGGSGGAIDALVEASVSIKNSSLTYNIAERNGGAVHGASAGTITISNSVLNNNELPTIIVGDESGGGVGTINTKLKIENSSFQNNSAPVGGGAVFFHIPFDDGEVYTLDVSNSSFTNNSTGPVGGGGINIFAIKPHAGSQATVSSCTFNKNVGGNGGGVYVDSLPTQLSNLNFKSNQAWDTGGGLLVSDFADAIFGASDLSSRPVTTLTNASFNNNAVIGIPPGAPLTPVTVFNFLAQAFGGSNFTTLSPGGGGLAVISAGNFSLTNATFTGNTVIGNGGGILVGGSAGSAVGFNQAYAIISNASCSNNHATVGGNNTDVLDVGNVGIGPNGVDLIGTCN
jgi:hypothetical protein